MVTSRRLQAAASAEARRLIKRRDRISQRIAPLRAEIDAIDERIALIEKAAGLALAHVDLETPPVPAAVLGIPLVGKAIRVQAVRSMLDRYPLGHAAHARDWFAAYRDDGYAVVSADPFAAFLTQLTRSPMVESSSRRGVYALVSESPIRGLCESIRTVYAQAQAADDPEEKMGLLRDARRLMRLRSECEACGQTWGADAVSPNCRSGVSS